MKLEFSAGGIVFKKVHSASHSTVSSDQIGSGFKVFVLLAQHSGHHGWVFPKGHIADHTKNESVEEAALREVFEETGAKGKILQTLTPIEYFYEEENEKIKKTVQYFLMEYIGGDITKHDWEMENVEFLPIDEVKQKLTYESDKKVWQETKQLITKSV